MNTIYVLITVFGQVGLSLMTCSILPQVQVMKIKDPGSMDHPVEVSSWQLLEYLHITSLQIIMFVYMVVKSNKKTVLVKIIIHYLLAKIEMNFIIKHKRKTSGLKFLLAQSKLRKEIIAHSEIKIISLRKFIIVKDLSSSSFFQPEPLHQS